VFVIAMFVPNRAHTAASTGAASSVREPMTKQYGLDREMSAPTNTKSLLSTVSKYPVAFDLTVHTDELRMLSNLPLDENDFIGLIRKYRFSLLGLTNEPVTSKILPDLAHLPLTYLNLDGTHISDTNMELLSAVKTLTSLFLAKTDIGTPTAKAISKLPNLEVLRLSNTRIADGDLRFLRPIKTLRSLELANCKITDAGVEELAKMPIEVLDLGGCDILTGTKVAKTTDLSGLSALKTLRLLLLDPSAKLASMEHRSLPDCRIVTKEYFTPSIFSYASQYSTEPDITLLNMGQPREAELEREYLAGRSLYEHNLYQLAIQYLTQYIKARTALHPTGVEQGEQLSNAYRFRSYSYAKLKQFRTAIADLNEVLKMQPKDPFLLKSRAEYSELLKKSSHQRS
jgi:Leucine Rich repeat